MLLHIEALALVALAAFLAVPATAWLARARWPSRSPRAALILWQAMGWGGGLGLLSAGLTLAAGSVHDHWRDGIAALPERWPHLGPWGWAGMTVTVGLGAWLVGVAIASAARVTAARRAHRKRLDLISDALEVDDGPARETSWEVRVVDHAHPLAYCLPGLRPRVVLTRGALETLADPQLTAVLAHERAHARGYHDLVIQPFIAWAQTFPFLRPAREAVRAVSLLVEMLADDVALRSCSAADLSAALRSLSGQHIATTGSRPADWRRDLDARVRRLTPGAPQPLSRPRRALAYVGAVALVCAPPVMLAVS